MLDLYCGTATLQPRHKALIYWTFLFEKDKDHWLALLPRSITGRDPLAGTAFASSSVYSLRNLQTETLGFE